MAARGPGGDAAHVAARAAAAGLPPGAGLVHAVGYVNDPLSHGLVGDGLLSLNEVIQLHNRVLTLPQLSVAEQMQVSGFGASTDVGWASIDSINLTTITVERDFDVILDLPHGLSISGGGERPLIDFTNSNVRHGFRSLSNLCSWNNVILFGGPYGIDLVQTTAGGITNGCTLNDVDFENQTQFGLRCTVGAPAGNGRLQMQRCRFTNMPSAIRFDEQAFGAFGRWTLRNVRMRSVSNCFELLLGSGGVSSLDLHQLDFDVQGTGVRVARPNNADRPLVLGSNFAVIRAASPFDVATSPIGPTQATLRMADLTSTAPANPALAFGPLGGTLSGEIDELRVNGDVALLGGGNLPLTVTNGRFRNSAVQLGSNSAGTMVVRDTRFDLCAIATQGAGAVLFEGCCVVGGSLQGTATAPLVCNATHVQAGVGTGVVQNTPLAAAQLGSLTVLPQTIAINGPLIYQADLPPGLFALFTLGYSQDALFLQLLPYPLHAYSELASTATLPGVYRLQQSFQVQIPNDLNLVSWDLTAQMAVLPDPAMQAPWINLPPGRRFVIE